MKRHKNDSSYGNQSKERLKTIVAKNYQTAIIGILDSIEKHIGDLWGHGVDYSELTEDQAEERKAWQALREEILDKGNHQKRSSLQEIDQYSVKWNRYNYDFVVKK